MSSHSFVCQSLGRKCLVECRWSLMLNALQCSRDLWHHRLSWRHTLLDHHSIPQCARHHPQVHIAEFLSTLRALPQLQTSHVSISVPHVSQSQPSRLVYSWPQTHWTTQTTVLKLTFNISNVGEALYNQCQVWLAVLLCFFLSFLPSSFPLSFFLSFSVFHTKASLLRLIHISVPALSCVGWKLSEKLWTLEASCPSSTHLETTEGSSRQQLQLPLS